MDRISFRITHSLFGEPKSQESNFLAQYYVINIENYLKRLGYDIVEYVVGIHLEADSPHIHLHYLVNVGKSHIPKVFIQHWKYTFKEGRLPTELPEKQHKYPSLVDYKHKSKINISIKFTKSQPQEESLENSKFLAYPLKEGLLVLSNIEKSRLESLSAQAQGTWNAVKIKKLKDKQRDENTATEYGKICEIISSGKPESYQDAVRIVLEELKKTRVEQKEHVNPQFIIKSV